MTKPGTYASSLLVLLALCCGHVVCQSASAPSSASQSAPAPQASKVPPASAKTAPTATSAKPSKAAPEKPAKRQLTAGQKQAVDLLQSVEGDMGRYSPEMQAYLLQEMASAYKGIDRGKQVELLKKRSKRRQTCRRDAIEWCRNARSSAR